MLEITPVRAFADNYIWLVRGNRNDTVAVVDPGDAGPVIEALRTEHLELVAILVTHHHGDHTGGIRELLEHRSVPVYGPAGEHIPALTHPLRDGDEVTLDMLPARFTVLDVPGHTRGHIAYYGEGALFCGDTVFSVGCGRLFEGTAEQMHRSLEKIRALPDDTQVYCAHEYTLANIGFAKVVEPENPDLLQRETEARALRAQGRPTVPSSLGLEKHTNPFLRSHVPNVIAAAEKFAGRRLTDGPDVFGTVRYWKDTLD